MDLLEELKMKEINVDEGLNRFMGNAGLYKKMLVKFLDLIKNAPTEDDFDSSDYTGAIEKAHAMKGATGNLSITPLYKAYTEITNLLRSNQPEQAKAVFKETLPVQDDIIECIKKYS